MSDKQFYGIWVYSLLCLFLVLLYRYATGFFEPKIAGLNLSLWTVLIVNIVLVIFSLMTFKKSMVISLLGLVSIPLSIYFFYESWTRLNYEYLAGFLAMPIILLLIVTLVKPRPKGKALEALPA